MSLSLITPPIGEPVRVDDLKAHLRVSDSAEDALIARLGRAARQTIETRHGLALVTQGWRRTLAVEAHAGALVDHRAIDLVPGPLIRVDQITASNGPLAADAFRVTTGLHGAVRLNRPTGARQLTIDFTAGFGGADDVPGDIRLAITMLTAHYFENREAVRDDRLFAVPEAVSALIAPWRRVSL